MDGGNSNSNSNSTSNSNSNSTSNGYLIGAFGGANTLLDASGHHQAQSSSSAPSNNKNHANIVQLYQKRHRTTFNQYQLNMLEEAFKQNSYPGPTFREALANQTNLDASRVQVWFQNRRAKHKKQLNQAMRFQPMQQQQAQHQQLHHLAISTHHHHHHHNPLSQLTKSHLNMSFNKHQLGAVCQSQQSASQLINSGNNCNNHINNDNTDIQHQHHILPSLINGVGALSPLSHDTSSLQTQNLLATQCSMIHQHHMNTNSQLQQHQQHQLGATANVGQLLTMASTCSNSPLFVNFNGHPAHRIHANQQHHHHHHHQQQPQPQPQQQLHHDQPTVASPQQQQHYLSNQASNLLQQHQHSDALVRAHLNDVVDDEEDEDDDSGDGSVAFCHQLNSQLNIAAAAAAAAAAAVVANNSTAPITEPKSALSFKQQAIINDNCHPNSQCNEGQAQQTDQMVANQLQEAQLEHLQQDVDIVANPELEQRQQHEQQQQQLQYYEYYKHIGSLARSTVEYLQG